MQTFTTAIFKNTRWKILSLIGTIALFAAAGLFISGLTGCNESNSVSVNTNDTVSVAGRVENTSMAKTATGVQGAVVTAFTITADGSRGSQVAQATTDAQGYFQLKTLARGSQNWLLVTTQGNMEWMTRFNGTLADNKQDTARPINFESTLQTQVYLALQKGNPDEVKSAEITSAIDVNVAASNRSQYVAGDSTFRSNLVSHLRLEILAQSQARSAYLSHASSQYAADTAAASNSITSAESNLTLALYNANGDSVMTRQAEKAYLQTMISAYARSDSSALSYSRSNEAAYHATIMATASFTDSTRNAMRRRSLYVMAVASDSALLREFRRANASSVQLQAVATASAAFENSIDTSRSDASRDSIASHYRVALRAVFQSQNASSDSSFVALLNLTNGTLAATLQQKSSDLRAALVADIATSNASGIGQDLQSFHAQATGSILAQWQINSHNTGNADRNSAMAQIMAFLSVSSNSSHTGS